MNNRILYSDNGVLTDLSVELNKYKTGTAVIPAFVAAEDAIYIGSRAPFNHFFLRVGDTPNTASTTMSLKYWEGNDFHSVVEIIDETDGITQDGYVTFQPDRDERWHRESTDDDGGQTIPELNTVVIYDLYWLEVKFDNDLDVNSEISFVGQKFSDDDDLDSEYPDLNRQTMKDTFSDTPGAKTDWEEQEVRAAEIIIKDLISKNIINDKSEILVRDNLKLASIMKTAEIIYRGLGDDYADDKRSARGEYNSRLKSGIYQTDRNADGDLNVNEGENRTGFMQR